MVILKLMPTTNCKACGYATCMAYVAVLREDEIRPEDSQLLWEARHPSEWKPRGLPPMSCAFVMRIKAHVINALTTL